jgi:hypothetical protein
MTTHRSPLLPTASVSLLRRALLLGAIPLLLACGDDDDDGAGPDPGPSTVLSFTGRGMMADRYMAELWVRGTTAYTTTWGLRGAAGRGNQVHVWDVSGDTPALVHTLTIDDATTLGDVQVSDDGRLLVVATERANGSIVLYDLADPRRPVLIKRHQTPATIDGVHTAEVARVDGTLYAFLSVDPPNSRLVIVDLSDPANPREVLVRTMGDPFIHDVFVRDGILFTALWSTGTTIWDIGGGGKGGTPANPVEIATIRTASSTASGSSSAHNAWWFHDPSSGERRYLFVGEEGPGGVTGTQSSGDVHVVDVSTMAQPREVAFFHVGGAGTHNFSMDEARGILYAAFYNGGVRAIDVRGDLGTCTAAQKSGDGRCNLGLMGRELARLEPGSLDVFFWGVQWTGTHVYGSDMFHGLWKLRAVTR